MDDFYMISPSEKIKEKIIKRYNSNPIGWRIIFGKDNYGHFNTAIAHETNIFLIKEEQINPYKYVGFGTEISTEMDVFKKISPHTFGLRPVSEKQIKKLSKGLNLGNKKFKDVFSDIMRNNPVSADKIDSSIVLQGPIVSSERTTNIISQKNKELDAKLRSELKKLLNKKYPQTFTPYS
jgi:hypothetical protein